MMPTDPLLIESVHATIPPIEHSHPGGAGLKQTEIDFGASPVTEKEFVVTDAGVTAASHLIGMLAYEAPTGKDFDEAEMDSFDLRFGPGAGQFTLLARAAEGSVYGTFKINYLVG